MQWVGPQGPPAHTKARMERANYDGLRAYHLPASMRSGSRSGSDGGNGKLPWWAIATADKHMVQVWECVRPGKVAPTTESVGWFLEGSGPDRAK